MSNCQKLRLAGIFRPIAPEIGRFVPACGWRQPFLGWQRVGLWLATAVFHFSFVILDFEEQLAWRLESTCLLANR